MVNDCLLTFGAPETPWGGVKQSGIGRTHSDDGLRDLCQTRHVNYDRIALKQGAVVVSLLRQGLQADPQADAVDLPMSTKTVDKPWGNELIWASTDRYVGKILHIKKGHSLSLQYHSQEGRDGDGAERQDGVRALPRGRGAAVDRARAARSRSTSRRGLRHRMIALEDTDVVEVSTTELDDVVRLEDATAARARPRP